MNLQKIRLLENSYDVCGGSRKEGMGFIYDASSPRGKCPLHKTLMSNKCSFDCKYCANSVKNNPRDSFEPQELAATFIGLLRKHRLEGLFLSSAIDGDADRSTERMIEAVKLVRQRYGYNGYIHFKVLPGTSYGLVKEASEMVDRMSINIEAPSKSRINELCSLKEYRTDILRRQAWISQLHSSQTTQMIVGAADETDFEILKMADWEYRSFNLKRIYFSAFSPIKKTALEARQATPLSRQNTLYNVDFLMRKYGYQLKEFSEIMRNEMLPNKDPKVAIAQNSLGSAVDVNEAEFHELIRVPGIGPKTAKKIIATRKHERLETRKQMQQAGIILKRAEPFLEINGYRQKMMMEF